MLKRKSPGEVAFITVCSVCMVLFAVITLLPFLNVIAKSASSEGAVVTGRVKFWPIGFQLTTYEYVLKQVEFQNGLKVSLVTTILGTFAAVFIAATVAYPLSKPQMVGRKFFMMVFVFVMLFSGGMIPSYMLYRTMGLTNTIWALITSGMCSVFNILLIKTFYEQLPESVEESARMDGASNMRALFYIVLPMSMPVIATVTLFYAVGYWNGYFAGILYITKPGLKPLQQYLYDLVKASQTSPDANTMTDATAYMNTNPESIRSATIFLATAPILLVYPFLQKYFVKGVNIGSVKG